MVTKKIGKGEAGAGVALLEECLNGVVDEFQSIKSTFDNLLQELDSDSGVSDTDYESSLSFSISSTKTNAETVKQVPQFIGQGEGGGYLHELPELFDSISNDLNSVENEMTSLTDKLEADSGTSTGDYSAGNFLRTLNRVSETLDSFSMDADTGFGEAGARIPGLPDDVQELLNDASNIETAFSDLLTKLDNDAGLSDTDYASTHGITVGTQIQ